MRVENEDIEPVTELGLSLSYYSSQRVQRRFNSASADAGTNAGTRVVDREFASTDPLSELVWSPKNGPSLKWADCSFGNKNPSLFFGAGPSNWVLSPHIIEENFIMAGRDTSARTPESDAAAILVCGSSSHEDRTADEPVPDFVENELSSRNPAGGGVEIGTGMASEVKFSAWFLGNERKNKKTVTNSLLEKLESISENDLQTLISKNAHEVKNSVSGNNSPTTSRILRYRRKGKEKVALSHGDVNGRMCKEEDEDDDSSHESVESCNSTRRIFSTGKKRRSFEQQLIVGSKRVKRQIHGSPGSTSSFIKQDSSFMNWISNMMKKGLSRSNAEDEEDQAPSLALTLAHPYSKNQDYGGFRSIFQSLYCPKMKLQDRMMCDRMMSEDQAPSLAPTPIALHGDNGDLCRQFLLSNGNAATSPSNQPKISSSSQENSEASSVENKNSSNLATDKGEGGTESNSSMDNNKHTPSEVKISNDFFGHGSNHLGSLWITRFTPKTSIPLLNFECQNQISNGQVLESSINFQGLVSPRERKPEAMASVFARRLDALKHIVPSDVTHNQSEQVESSQISEASKGIFEVIKTLRLSRTDILKSLKSHISLEHLDGFFLRLRLGKWEGLGGTGYFVACITGAQTESSSENSRNLISVNAGGIKCTVESQYISNHDFLQDELTAWWSATAKNGGKIPSEEDLRLKLEERKMLGL